jgi:hypothetical protein
VSVTHRHLASPIPEGSPPLPGGERAARLGEPRVSLGERGEGAPSVSATTEPPHPDRAAAAARSDLSPPGRGGAISPSWPNSEPAKLPSLTILACGALARELTAIVARNNLVGVRIACLPAKLHNRPQLIPELVRRKIHRLRDLGAPVFCAYADCGTGGELDRVLAEEGVERLPGAHCYAFYAGIAAFDALHEEEPGTFYLTDYLARHFDTLIVKGLALDRHPELFDDYFRNYRRLVYLAQSPTPDLMRRAEHAATFLKLPLVVRETGYGLLELETLARVS